MNAKKVIIISLLSLTLLGGAYFLYKKLSSSATAESKRNRRIKFNTNPTTSSIGGNTTKVEFQVGDSIIDIPSLPESFYDTTTKVAQVKMTLATIELKYGAYINNIAAITNVKPELIKSFIFVESNGDPNIMGGISVGLMQVNPTTAQDVIKMEIKKGRLNAQEKAIILKYLPNINWANPVVTTADLKKPEFNILMGTLYMGILIDEETVTEKVVIAPATSIFGGELKTEEVSVMVKKIRLDHVIVRYNQGYYKYIVGTKPAGNTSTVCTKVGITFSYIKKILGTGGTLSLLVK
ncbi:MAG: transglycosylase SLT domain-containing protein [archaeon]